MTSSTAIPEWFTAHPYLQWVFPSIVLLALICIVIASIINIKNIKKEKDYKNAN